LASLSTKLLLFSISELKIIGQYIFDAKKRTHIIRISPKLNKAKTNGDSNAEKYQLVSTVLHEVRHAQQKEERGMEFWRKRYNTAVDVIHPAFSDFYSECEIDARTFENANVLSAQSGAEKRH
jgi:hypothetical protein